MKINKKVLIPSISYTIHNAKEDIGNFENDLRNYVKKTDYEKDKEDLITDEEFTNTLNSYTTKIYLNNELKNYVTNDLLSQSLSNRPTFSVTDEIQETVNLNDERITALENN